MKIANTLVGFLLVAAVGAAGYFSYIHYTSRQRECGICGRQVYPKMQATVFLKDSSRIVTCCPRCALHARAQRPSGVARIAVADYNTGETVSADQATFVEGSDVECCRPDPNSTPREPGVEYDLKFDRCLPGLHAFKSETAALDFQRQYHGRVLSFERALESVTHH
jgi:hypothetical protein